MQELNTIEEVERVNNLITLMQAQRKVKIFKIRKNPFDLYSDEQFRLKYRFSKGGVTFLDQLFGRSLNMDTRSGGLSSVLQIVIALRYWGRNQVQDDAVDIHGLTQQSITTAVCDGRLKIRNIVARWRGSTHDSRIFNESLFKQSFENGVLWQVTG